MKLGQNKDGNQMPHQSIDTTDFRSLAAIIFHFLKNTCLRTMECLHWELTFVQVFQQCKGFQLVMHIYMHTFQMTYFMFSWDFSLFYVFCYCNFYVIFR